MKFDVTTAIITAIVGVIVAYLVTNSMILGTPKPINIKSPSSTISADLSEPDVNVFNYRALNPTVEVYVGEECQNYDELKGVCLDGTEEE